MDYRNLVKNLLMPLVTKHPGPWVIDQDWTLEVVAADGATVASHLTPDEAVAVVTLGSELRSWRTLRMNNICTYTGESGCMCGECLQSYWTG